MSDDEQQKTLKALLGLGRTATATATAMRNYPDRFNVKDVTADGLEADGRAAEGIDVVINDLAIALATFKQSNLLKDEKAHRQLLMVNTYVNGQKKYDATLPDLVPELKEYFSKKK